MRKREGGREGGHNVGREREREREHLKMPHDHYVVPPFITLAQLT